MKEFWKPTKGKIIIAFLLIIVYFASLRCLMVADPRPEETELVGYTGRPPLCSITMVLVYAVSFPQAAFQSFFQNMGSSSMFITLIGFIVATLGIPYLIAALIIALYKRISNQKKKRKKSKSLQKL